VQKSGIQIDSDRTFRIRFWLPDANGYVTEAAYVGCAMRLGCLAVPLLRSLSRLRSQSYFGFVFYCAAPTQGLLK
jgi:hypothetical protein